jgi:uncharacterized protein YecE (DUF72 family)
MAKVWIGTSGYYYNHWREGVFYPTKLPKQKELEYYSQFFDTVELNVTFYRLPQEKAFLTWCEKTPKEFLFSIKGSRFITHIKRLKDCAEPLKRFFERASLLKQKLGVILWQLPPNFKCDIGRLENFVNSLYPYNDYYHTFEFRHLSWFCRETHEIIKQHKTAICQSDWPDLVEVENDYPFIYIRRHGSPLYAGCYSKKELQQDAEYIICQLNSGRDAFVYFNNDAFGYAIKNALELKEIIKNMERT